MKKIGLTGGIGSGKSTVAKFIRFLGFQVYVADYEAKKIINTDEGVRLAIIDLLGEKAYTSLGYNRRYVAQKVFNDRGLLNKLNAIVHPAVNNHFNDWCKLNNTNEFVFQEAAILFENGSFKKFDKTILVTAPEDVRMERVMKRDGFTEREVKVRMDKQWDDDKKIPLADFVVKCDGNHLVISQMLGIIKQIGWEY